MPDQQVWAVHAGKTGDANSLFLNQNCIALGWRVSDLSKLAPNRDAFKAELARVYPDAKAGSLPVNAGQLFRFIYEMKVGDLVLYPAKRERLIYIGRVESEYFYEKKDEPYRHRRKVKWLQNLARTSFTQGALHEVGSALSFFLVKSYAEEFLTALEGKKEAITVAVDMTATEVADEVEQQTGDFILKTLARELKGNLFEDFVAHLLQAMGYQTRQRYRQKGADGGVDIIAHRDELGFEPPIIKVQVKSGDGSVGQPDVSALAGHCKGSGEYGLVISLGNFTKQARSYEENHANMRLIGGDELVRLILEHYEKFDGKYKGLLPLKRVFVPDLESRDD